MIEARPIETLTYSTDSPHQRIRVLLFCLLVGIYLLVYSSHPTSLDDQSVIAEAVTLAQHGRPDINAIAYTEWLLPISFSGMGHLGIDGALYSKREPVRALSLLPFVVTARLLPWLPVRPTAMLFNTLVTAATAVVLYEFVRRLGYRTATAFLSALIYGLATFALVYAKTLFAEPLAALLLLCGLLAAQHYRAQASQRSALLAGLCCGLILDVNNAYALFIPLIALFLFGFSLHRFRHILAFLAPILVFLSLLAIYNLARYGSPVQSGYKFDEGEGFVNPLLTGLYGLFLSPFRGLFWYNPILLLSALGWFMLRRRDARLAGIIVGLVAVQSIVFAAWWSWHGGVVWGPRFLVTVTPLLVLCLAPLIEVMWHQKALHIAVGALAVFSVTIQILGVIIDAGAYTNSYLNAFYWTGQVRSIVPMLSDDVLYDLALSPILGNLALLRAGWPLEPAWLNPDVNVSQLLVSLAVIGLGILMAFRPIRYRWPVVLIVIVLAFNLIATGQRQGEEYEQAQALEQMLQPPGLVVAATTQFGDALLEIDNGSRFVVMNAPTTPDDALAATLWDYALRQGTRLWYLTWFGPADPANWQERQLWETASFVQEKWVADHRALWFDLTPTPVPDHAAEWRFGHIRLNHYGIESTDEGLRIVLVWSAIETEDKGFSWFVHVLDSNDQIIAQQDRQPLGGYAPTSTWIPGATISDRLFFPISAGGVKLRIGWVDPANGRRLPVYDSHDERLDNDFVLLDVEDD